MNRALRMACGKEEAEQAKAAANVKDLSPLRKILSYLFEEAEAEDLKPAPAVCANDRRVV